MNRIRKIKDEYEVLVTPNLTFSPDMEILTGNWTDPYLKGFYIEKFDNQQDAYQLSVTMADINWGKLVEMHRDFYNIIENKVITILDSNNFTYDINTKIMTPAELKHTMFDRVEILGGKFTTTNHLNDIVTVTVTNPWSENLEDMCRTLKSIKDLRIKKIQRSFGTISLIGTTYLGSSYEIRLVPSLIESVMSWKKKNIRSKHDLQRFTSVMNEIFELQDKIDSSSRLR